jgi:hypothetical protein
MIRLTPVIIHTYLVRDVRENHRKSVVSIIQDVSHHEIIYNESSRCCFVDDTLQSIELAFVFFSVVLVVVVVVVVIMRSTFFEPSMAKVPMRFKLVIV